MHPFSGGTRIPPGACTLHPFSDLIEYAYLYSFRRTVQAVPAGFFLELTPGLFTLKYVVL